MLGINEEMEKIIQKENKDDYCNLSGPTIADRQAA